MEQTPTKLYKEIWLHYIIPQMDNKTLLDFSAASKETRQLAFAELFKRKEFSDHIYTLILKAKGEVGWCNDHLRNESMWGKSNLPAASRLMQMLCYGFILLALIFAQDIHFNGYPTPEELKINFENWQKSPASLEEFGPASAFISFIPDDNLKTLTKFVLGLVCVSFIFRAVFKYTNDAAIHEYNDAKQTLPLKNLKVERLTYLRDQLPKQSIATHSLFRKFIDTSAANEESSQHCIIL